MIALIVYATGFLISSAVLSRKILWNHRDEFGRVDTEDYVMSSIIGITAGLVWPASLAVLWWTTILKRDMETHHPREIERQQIMRDRELTEREREIRRMERELGIGESS